MNRVGVRALLLLGAAVLVCWPSWLRADWDGTEGRRVQIALEMLRSGDWLVPTLGGEPTWAKPPLHYWALASMAWLFGDGFVALRLPAVLSVFAASFAAGELLRRYYGSTAGWVGAFGVLCSPIVVFVWPTAEIDPMFASLTALSLWFLATGVARERAALVLASGVLAGCAFLQKGPPFFLFAFGAYLVWWRHRGMRFGWLHFAPLLLLVSAYFVPLWLWRIDPGEMLAIANEESVGRIAFFQWKHVRETPWFWLRAVLVQVPFVLWCFWEWRGARDARMNASDLTLRMCSGGAVVAIVLLTFFPGRPTRYMLPNVPLFTFAVSPAVAHFYCFRGALPRFARSIVTAVGVLGALALVALPFVRGVGAAALALALAAALLPLWARSPRRVVIACLLLPVIGAWSVGLDRSVRWPQSKRARVAAGELLRDELEQLGAVDQLATYGHIDSALLLATKLWPPGDEAKRVIPPNSWLLHEIVPWQPFVSPQHQPKLRLHLPYKTMVVQQRIEEVR